MKKRTLCLSTSFAGWRLIETQQSYLQTLNMHYHRYQTRRRTSDGKNVAKRSKIGPKRWPTKPGSYATNRGEARHSSDLPKCALIVNFFNRLSKTRSVYGHLYRRPSQASPTGRSHQDPQHHFIPTHYNFEAVFGSYTLVSLEVWNIE